jgi:hypothetical protein
MLLDRPRAGTIMDMLTRHGISWVNYRPAGSDHSGSLPSFCIVDPDFRSFSEENPQDIRKGESFAAEVISRVMHGPDWADTLLIAPARGSRAGFRSFARAPAWCCGGERLPRAGTWPARLPQACLPVAWFNSGPGDRPQNGAAWQYGFDLAARGGGGGVGAGGQVPGMPVMYFAQDQSWPAVSRSRRS